MKKNLMRYFASPVFEGEEDKTRRAYLLNTIILISIVLVGIIIVGNLIGGNAYPVTYIIDIVFISILFFLRFSLQRGKITFTGVVLIALLIMTIIVSAISLGTIRTPVSSAFMLAIIIAGFLFGKKGLLRSSIISSLAVLGLIYTENARILPSPDYSVNLTQWFTYSTFFALTGVLSYFAYQSTQQALKDSIERKEAELQRDLTLEALRISESNLHAFMKNAKGFGVYSTKLTNGGVYKPQIAFASPSIKDILGIENPTENAQWFKNVHNGDRDRVAKAHHISRKSGENFDETFRIYHHLKKEWRWIRAISSAVFLEDGSFPYFNGLIIDITEFKNVEEALRKSEKKFRDLFEKSEDAISILKEGVFIDCNQATLKMLGYEDKNAILDKNPAELSPKRQPDGRLSIEASEKMMQLAIKKGSHRFIWHHLRANGETFPAEILLTVINLENDEQILYTTWRDITKQIQAEQSLREGERKYRTLIEQSNDVIYLLYQNRFEIINFRFTEIFGVSPKEATSPDFNFIDLVAPRSKKMILERMAKSEQGEKLPQRYEFAALDKNGHEIEMGVSVSYISYKDGVATQGILRDITERKKAEMKLQKANEQLQAQLNEIKELESALREQAIRDHLTGLYNRRYMEEILKLELAKASRRKIPLSIVILDLDNLKEINDTYGHISGGDLSLKKFADTLTRLCRAEDTICRYGGDEFLVMLYDTPVGTAYERTLQWKEAVAKLKIKAKDTEFGITFSAGVAAFPRDGLTREEFLIHADDALYRAKKLGRNRVVIHQPAT